MSISDKIYNKGMSYPKTFPYRFLYHFSKVMTDLVDYSKAQFSLSRAGIAISDVSHDY
jgi:hypothetical protein